MPEEITGELDLGDQVVPATFSAVGEQSSFADPGNINPAETCGQCGAIVGSDTKDGEECPTCGAIWPTPAE